jgi:hypothetical protein
MDAPQGSSLVKYMNDQNGRGRGRLHWHRATRDGLPFRGEMNPMMREEEFEERLVEVKDARNGIFDVNDPDQNARYQQILDRITNGWAQLIYVDRMPVPEQRTWIVYIEWADRFMEDGHPTAAMHQQNSGMMPHVQQPG